MICSSSSANPMGETCSWVSCLGTTGVTGYFGIRRRGTLWSAKMGTGDCLMLLRVGRRLTVCRVAFGDSHKCLGLSLSSFVMSVLRLFWHQTVLYTACGRFAFLRHQFTTCEPHLYRCNPQRHSQKSLPSQLRLQPRPRRKILHPA